MISSPLLSQVEAKKDQSDIALINEQYSKLLEEMGEEGKHLELKNAFFIHLLNTGEQPSFQDVLPFLLDVPCIKSKCLMQPSAWKRESAHLIPL